MMGVIILGDVFLTGLFVVLLTLGFKGKNGVCPESTVSHLTFLHLV